LHSLVGRGVLPAAYTTDDGAGVLYRGTQFVESVGYEVIETPLDVRRL
jgi:hypothetical protein